MRGANHAMITGGGGGTTMGCVGKYDDTNGGSGRKDEVAEVLGDVVDVFGGVVEDETTFKYSN